MIADIAPNKMCVKMYINARYNTYEEALEAGIQEALKLICDYAFGFLYLKQLIVHVTSDNEKSIRLFKSCGFKQCGLLREWWCVGGRYKDVILMQYIRNVN